MRAVSLERIIHGNLAWRDLVADVLFFDFFVSLINSCLPSPLLCLQFLSFYKNCSRGIGLPRLSERAHDFYRTEHFDFSLICTSMKITITCRNIEGVLGERGFVWPRNRVLRFFYPHVLCLGAVGFTLAIACLGAGVYIRVQNTATFSACVLFYFWGMLSSARKTIREFRQGKLSFHSLHVFWSMALGLAFLCYLCSFAERHAEIH